MDAKQTAWLAQLTGKREQREEVKALNTKRDAIRSQVELSVIKMGDQLYKDMDLTASDGKRTQKLVNFGRRDQTTEFDIDDQQEGFTLLDDADVARHLEANRIVTSLSQQFDAEMEVVDRDENGAAKLDSSRQPIKKKVRVFDEKDLGAEFYQPLVRQGLMGETFVPDEFSATREMLDESSALYRERLEQDHVANPVMRFMKENKALVMTTLGSGVSAAAQGIKFDGLKSFDMKEALGEDELTFGRNLISKSKDAAGPIAEVVAMGWDIVSDKIPEAVGDVKEGIQGGLEARRAGKGSRLRDFERLAALTVAAVAARLSAALAPYQLDVAAASVFSSRTSQPTLAAALITEPLAKAQVDAAVAAICTGVEAALRVADPQTGGSSALIDAAVATVKSTYASSLAAPAVIGALKPGAEKYDAVIQAFANAAQAAFTAATQAAPFAQLLTDNKGTMATKMVKKAGEDMVADMDAEGEASRNELAAIRNAETDSKMAGLLAAKIAKMENDQKILKWASGLAGLGFDIASKFIAPMAIAGSAVKLSVNIAKAAMRTRDFLVFAASQEDMFRAASAYSAPVDNFVTNAEQQAAHYTIVAALELVNMIGAIVETAGMASGMGAAAGVVAGKALQATAAAGQALEAVLYEIKKRYDVEKAWSEYRTALLRPDNRKLGLIAMKKNPTLAKYAVAWGAVIKKDPLVGDFIGKCGLDTATLRDPKSNLDLVVKYLEVRLADDSTITGRLPVTTDWEPPNLALTPASWAAVIRRAEQQAQLIHKDTRSIELALSAFAPAFDALQKECAAAKPPGTGTRPAKSRFDACAELLNAVERALRGYVPELSTSKGPIRHEQMVLVRQKFEDKVAEAREAMAAL